MNPLFVLVLAVLPISLPFSISGNIDLEASIQAPVEIDNIESVIIAQKIEMKNISTQEVTIIGGHIEIKNDSNVSISNQTAILTIENGSIRSDKAIKITFHSVNGTIKIKNCRILLGGFDINVKENGIEIENGKIEARTRNISFGDIGGLNSTMEKSSERISGIWIDRDFFTTDEAKITNESIEFTKNFEIKTTPPAYIKFPLELWLGAILLIIFSAHFAKKRSLTADKKLKIPSIILSIAFFLLAIYFFDKSIEKILGASIFNRLWSVSSFHDLLYSINLSTEVVMIEFVSLIAMLILIALPIYFISRSTLRFFRLRRSAEKLSLSIAFMSVIYFAKCTEFIDLTISFFAKDLLANLPLYLSSTFL
jgi:hypothetical protein